MESELASLDYPDLMTQTALLEARLECMVLNETWLGHQDNSSSPPSCPPDFDGVMCWMPTRAGVIAEVPCMAELHGIRYDTRGE